MSEKEEGVKIFRPLINRTLLVILVFLGGFLAWAALAPLTTGAVAPGLVTVASYRKTVQHQSGGVVEDILVKEGDFVKTGQILLKLDDVNAKAQLAQVRSEYFQAVVAKYRLIAERTFSGKISYPPEIIKMSKDPEFARFMMRQNELYLARKQRYEAERKGAVDMISSLRQTSERLTEQKRSHERQLDIQKQQLDSLKELAEQGYYAKNRYLDLQRSYEEVYGRKTEAEANLARTESSIKEYGVRLRNFETEYARQVETELNDVEKSVTALREQYAAALSVLERTVVKAPEDGMVMGLRIHTIGGVISPGQPLLEIVPKKATLIVEARVFPGDIEGLKVESKVDLRFPALDPKKTPVFEGTVSYLSPDIQFDEHSRASYYLARADINESSLEEIHHFKHEIKPGMPVLMILKKGERTFLGYLLKVFIDRLSVAFTR